MKKLENYKKKIINEINNSDLDLTAIYRIVTSEELLSYARGLRLSKDATEIMENVNKLVDEVEIYYQELIATAKKLDKAMYVCLIVNAILLFNSSPLALIVLFAGLHFARQAHELRQEFVDNTFRAEVKKKSNDLANTSYNIVNFINKRNKYHMILGQHGKMLLQLNTKKVIYITHILLIVEQEYWKDGLIMEQYVLERQDLINIIIRLNKNLMIMVQLGQQQLIIGLVN